MSSVRIRHIGKDGRFGILKPLKTIGQDVIYRLIAVDDAGVQKLLFQLRLAGHSGCLQHIVSYLEEIFNLDEFDSVQTIAVRKPAVVHQGQQTSIDGVDGGQNSNWSGSAGACIHGTQGSQDGSKHNLQDHENPSDDAHGVVEDKELPPLYDHIAI